MKKSGIKRNLIKIVVIMLMVGCVASLSGCESVSSWFATLKGDLVGNEYTITSYDNFGAEVLQVTGDKITLDGGTDEAGEASSYMDITIDGNEWNHVGNTLVFAQEGVDMITDFQLPKEINLTSGSSGLMGVDKFINSYKNLIGKKSVVVIYSQMGVPIGMFQGNSCFQEVPTNLPKTTKISIDGKLVYVHRANIDIIPMSLFD